MTCCQVCQTKQTNSTLLFHESDYQSVKHLSVPMHMSVITNSILNIKEEVETKGESVDKREGSDKGRTEMGLGQNIRGETLQAQKKNKDRD